VVWKDGSLVFDMVEIKDGKTLKSTEIWSLIDGGTTLRRVWKTEKAGEQTLIYCVNKVSSNTKARRLFVNTSRPINQLFTFAH
jgi:hypothetical protein